MPVPASRRARTEAAVSRHDHAEDPDAAQRLVVQARLRVSSPSDPAELEAESVADQFLSFSRSIAASETLDEEALDQAESSTGPDVHRSNAGSNAATQSVDHEIEGAIADSRNKGVRLPPATQQRYESFFGTSLNDVRVHDNADADGLCRSLSAEAFTTGRDIYFSGGSFDTSSERGQHLLAHEITHVVQQGGAIHRKERRNAIVPATPPPTPELISLADFSAAAKSAHWRMPLFHSKNAAEYAQDLITNYHSLPSGEGMLASKTIPRTRFQVLSELEMIADAYLEARAQQSYDAAGDKGSQVARDPETAQAGKEGKFQAFLDLRKQAIAGKSALAPFLEGQGVDLVDIETQAYDNKAVEKVRGKYTPKTAGAFFNSLAGIINKAAGERGSYFDGEFGIDFPFAPGLSAGVVIVIKAEKSLHKGDVQGELELRGRLEASIAKEIGGPKANIDLGMFLEAHVPSIEQLAEWFSLGVYDRLRKTLGAYSAAWGESTVNYLWFGSGGTNLNKARADEWLKGIERHLMMEPTREAFDEGEEGEQAYQDRKAAWEAQATETYVRAGGVVAAGADARLDAALVKLSMAVGAKGRSGTEITAGALHDYNTAGVDEREIGRQSFNEYEFSVELAINKHLGILKGGERTRGDSVEEFGEFEIKAGLPYPWATAASLLTSYGAKFRDYWNTKRLKEELTTNTLISGALEGRTIWQGLNDELPKITFEEEKVLGDLTMQNFTAATGPGVALRVKWTGNKVDWGLSYQSDVDIEVGGAVGVKFKKGQQVLAGKFTL